MIILDMVDSDSGNSRVSDFPSWISKQIFIFQFPRVEGEKMEVAVVHTLR